MPFFESRTTMNCTPMKSALACILVLSCSTAFAGSNLEKSGDVLQVLLPATAFGMSLLKEDDYQGSWQLIKTGVASRLVVEGLKATVTKKRPDGSGNDSFPSGHAADTFAASTFIQQRYGLKWAIPAYLAATYVGYTRVDSDKHDTEDVIIGAAIGVLSGVYFTDSYLGTSITPYAAEKGHYGLSISSRF